MCALANTIECADAMLIGSAFGPRLKQTSTARLLTILVFVVFVCSLSVQDIFTNDTDARIWRSPSQSGMFPSRPKSRAGATELSTLDGLLIFSLSLLGMALPTLCLARFELDNHANGEHDGVNLHAWILLSIAGAVPLMSAAAHLMRVIHNQMQETTLVSGDILASVVFDDGWPGNVYVKEARDPSRGLLKGDIVVSLDGAPVFSSAELRALLTTVTDLKEIKTRKRRSVRAMLVSVSLHLGSIAGSALIIWVSENRPSSSFWCGDDVLEQDYYDDGGTTDDYDDRDDYDDIVLNGAYGDYSYSYSYSDDHSDDSSYLCGLGVLRQFYETPDLQHLKYAIEVLSALVVGCEALLWACRWVAVARWQYRKQNDGAQRRSTDGGIVIPPMQNPLSIQSADANVANGSAAQPRDIPEHRKQNDGAQRRSTDEDIVISPNQNPSSVQSADATVANSSTTQPRGIPEHRKQIDGARRESTDGDAIPQMHNPPSTESADANISNGPATQPRDMLDIPDHSDISEEEVDAAQPRAAGEKPTAQKNVSRRSLSFSL